MVEVRTNLAVCPRFPGLGSNAASRRESKQQLQRLCIPNVRGGISLRSPCRFRKQAARFCATAAVFI